LRLKKPKLGDVLAICLYALCMAAIWFTTVSDAHAWQRVTSSWYGPGLWGNTTACGQVLTPELAGVAHRSLPCGTRVTLRYNGKIVRVKVVDRGPFVSGRTFDLTQKPARYLCGCRDWGVRSHLWARGWFPI
jgi:rare lipoprotein A (peptidoglycan hydrolase)